MAVPSSSPSGSLWSSSARQAPNPSPLACPLTSQGLSHPDLTWALQGGMDVAGKGLGVTGTCSSPGTPGAWDVMVELRHRGRNPGLLSTAHHSSLPRSTAPPQPPGRPRSGLSSPENAASPAGARQPQTPPAQPTHTETATQGTGGGSTKAVCSWPWSLTLTCPGTAALASGTRGQWWYEVPGLAPGTRCNGPVQQWVPTPSPEAAAHQRVFTKGSLP